MATLYTQVESNVRKTWFFLFLLFSFIIFLGWIFSYILDNNLILIIAVILSFLFNFYSYWYSDKFVIWLSRAKRIEKKDNPRLYRLVENLCITAGLPMPKIYIMPGRQANAFATGRDKNHSAIVFTEGILEKLEDEELEGVIAHELAHIGNRDILLSTILVVLVGIVALLSRFFLQISFFGGGRRRGREERSPILLILALALAILAPLFATLLRLAISRKREFLADATGALLTRYPEGLARALEKIAQDKEPLPQASSATAHLFIANPFKGRQKTNWLLKLFMTHPPIEERIKALREMSI